MHYRRPVAPLALLLVTGLSAASALQAQRTVSLGDLRFAHPGEGLPKDSIAGVIRYNDVQGRSMCLFQMATLVTDSSAPDARFRNEWQAAQETVKVPFPSTAPVPRRLSNGWTIVDGRSTVQSAQYGALTSRVVLFSDGRRSGYAATWINDTTRCAARADAFVASVQLPPATTSVAPAPAASSSASSTPPSGSVPAGDGRMPSAVTGARWRYVIVTEPASSYNSFTKQYEWSALRAQRQFKQVYVLTLGTDGRYLRELDAEDYNRAEISRIVERGTYVLSNGAAAFRPVALEEGVAKKGGTIVLRGGRTPAAYTWRYVLGAHPERPDADRGLHFFEDGIWRTWRPQ